MTGALVCSELRDGIALLMLNRPDKLNAINKEMIAQLGSALDAAEADPSVRAIVLAGVGRAFSAGFDLDMEIADGGKPDPEDVRQALRNDFEIIMRFWDCPKVTLAAAHGYCLGSAMELALACDITLASEDCFFGAPEVRFGSGIVAMLLPWLAGPKCAKYLLLSGDDRHMINCEHLLIPPSGVLSHAADVFTMHEWQQRTNPCDDGLDGGIVLGFDRQVCEVNTKIPHVTHECSRVP